MNNNIKKLIILYESIGSSSDEMDFEKEFQIYIEGNYEISIEDIFKQCKVNNHSCTVNFVPTSNAYRRYGTSAAIDICLNEGQAKIYSENILSNPPIKTFGEIKAKLLVDININGMFISMDSIITFNTNEICYRF